MKNFSAVPKIKVPESYRESLLFDKNETIKLKLSFTGRPTPTAEWSKDDVLLVKSDKCTVDTAEGVSSVIIPDAQRSNSGKYTLRVFNEHGEDVATVDVKVTDVPDAPGKPSVQQMSADSVQIQ